MFTVVYSYIFVSLFLHDLFVVTYTLLRWLRTCTMIVIWITFKYIFTNKNNFTFQRKVKLKIFYCMNTTCERKQFWTLPALVTSHGQPLGIAAKNPWNMLQKCISWTQDSSKWKRTFNYILNNSVLFKQKHCLWFQTKLICPVN